MPEVTQIFDFERFIFHATFNRPRNAEKMLWWAVEDNQTPSGDAFTLRAWYRYGDASVVWVKFYPSFSAETFREFANDLAEIRNAAAKHGIYLAAGSTSAAPASYQLGGGVS